MARRILTRWEVTEVDTVKARSPCTTAHWQTAACHARSPAACGMGSRLRRTLVSPTGTTGQSFLQERDQGPFSVDVMAWGEVGCWHLGGLGSLLDGLPAALQQRPPSSRPCCLTHTHTHTHYSEVATRREKLCIRIAAALSAENNHWVLPS